jgi:hypothetical protein
MGDSDAQQVSDERQLARAGDASALARRRQVRSPVNKEHRDGEHGGQEQRDRQNHF